MNNDSNLDMRSIANKLFVASHWVAGIAILAYIMTILSSGKVDGGGVLFIFYALVYLFGVPYAVYFIIFRSSKRLSKSGENMAIVSAILSVIIILWVVYVAFGLGYALTGGI